MLFADYEFGLPLMDIPSGRSGSLRCTGLPIIPKSMPRKLAGQSFQTALRRASLYDSPYRSRLSQAYIRQIHEAIRRGDTYQISYTARLHLQTYGNPFNFTAACASCAVCRFVLSA